MSASVPEVAGYQPRNTADRCRLQKEAQGIGKTLQPEKADEGFGNQPPMSRDPHFASGDTSGEAARTGAACFFAADFLGWTAGRPIAALEEFLFTASSTCD